MSGPPLQVTVSTPPVPSVVAVKIDPIPRATVLRNGPVQVAAGPSLPPNIVANSSGLFVYYGNYPDPPPGPGMLAVNILSNAVDANGDWWVDPYGNQLLDYFVVYSGDPGTAGVPVSAIAYGSDSIYYAETSAEEDPAAGWVSYSRISFYQDRIGLPVIEVSDTWEPGDENTAYSIWLTNPPPETTSFWYADGYGRPKWWNGSDSQTAPVLPQPSLDRSWSDPTITNITNGTGIQAATHLFNTNANSGQTQPGTGSNKIVYPSGMTFRLRTRFTCTWEGNSLMIYFGSSSFWSANLLATIPGSFAVAGTQCYGWMELEVTTVDQVGTVYAGLSGAITEGSGALAGANTLPLNSMPVTPYAYSPSDPICIGVAAGGNNAAQALTTYGSRFTRVA